MHVYDWSGTGEVFRHMAKAFGYDARYYVWLGKATKAYEYARRAAHFARRAQGEHC